MNRFGAVAHLYGKYREHYPTQVLEWLLAGLEAEYTVLDLASGTALAGIPLRPHVRRLLAIDIDLRMLEVAHASASGSGILIDCVAADAFHLPLTDASVHAVIMANSYHWLSHPGLTHSIARVLAPNGTVSLVTRSGILLGTERWKTILLSDPSIAGYAESSGEVNKLSDRRTLHASIQSTGQFTITGEDIVTNRLRRTAREYVSFLLTTSTFSHLVGTPNQTIFDERANKLIRECDGSRMLVEQIDYLCTRAVRKR